jgi:hypothetical protein
MSPIKWTATAVGLLMWGVPAEAAPPSIYTVYKDMTMELAPCMARARVAVAAAGFGNISNGKWSTYGYINDYTIVMRCLPEKQTVFVTVAGPTLEENDRLANAAINAF